MGERARAAEVAGPTGIAGAEEVCEDERIVRAVERLVVESVGVTTIALGQASPGVDLTFPQWRALVVIGSAPDGIRVGEIAGRIGSAVPTTSRLVRRLERRGLVDAMRDEADRRATRVRLTSAGESIRHALVVRRRELIRESLAGRAAPLAGELGAALEQIGDALGRYS